MPVPLVPAFFIFTNAFRNPLPDLSIAGLFIRPGTLSLQVREGFPDG